MNSLDCKACVKEMKAQLDHMNRVLDTLASRQGVNVLTVEEDAFRQLARGDSRAFKKLMKERAASKFQG